MLKSYNELSRWYSALEPETDAADPARPATADPAAGEDDGPDRYSRRPERAPSAEQTATPYGPGEVAVDRGRDEPADAPLDEPDSGIDTPAHSADSGTRADFGKPGFAVAGGEAEVSGQRADYGKSGSVVAGDAAEVRGRRADYSKSESAAAGESAEGRGRRADYDYADSGARDHDGADSRRRAADTESGSGDPDHAASADRAANSVDRHYGIHEDATPGHRNSGYGHGTRQSEPAPPPLAELAARRSDFTGGWSDWVEPAPGPDDDYAAELVQFPWPDAADEDDYDEARVLEPSGALRENLQRNRTWVVLAVSVLVLVLAATGALFLLFGREEGNTAQRATPLHFTAGNLTADTSGACPTERTDSVVRSAEAGGTGSGPDAVLAFQHAYYVTRSGTQARAVVTPDAEVSSAAVIQGGIDSIPVGTTHCVRITTVAPGRHTVEVTEFRPAGAPATYTKQLVRTALVGDRTLITGIAAG